MRTLPTLPSLLVASLAAIAAAGAVSAAAPPVKGTPGPDRLFGTNEPEYIEGGDGNDVIVAGDGDDVVRGGRGRDSFELGGGSDTILLSRGDGQDTVVGFDLGANRLDTVLFDKTINPNDVIVYRQPKYALVIQYGRGDKLVVPRHFEQEGYSGFRIDAIRFANGLVWDAEAIRRLVLTTRATPQYLVGYSSNDPIDGGAGNDQIFGGPGNDELLGGEGNDRLYGDEGNDVLIGGVGNDLMRGELGSDTYIYRHGDGMDTVQNFSRAGDVDVIRFVSHTRAAVDMTTKGTDLVLTLNGDPKSGIRIMNYNGSATHAITRIEFREGPPILQSEMDAKFPVVAKRMNVRSQQPVAAAPPRSARPTREAPVRPPAARPVRTPLESLINNSRSSQPPAAGTSQEIPDAD